MHIFLCVMAFLNKHTSHNDLCPREAPCAACSLCGCSLLLLPVSVWHITKHISGHIISVRHFSFDKEKCHIDPHNKDTDRHTQVRAQAVFSTDTCAASFPKSKLTYSQLQFR